MHKEYTLAFKASLVLRKEYQKKLLALAEEYRLAHQELRSKQDVIEEATGNYNENHMMPDFDDADEALNELMENL